MTATQVKRWNDIFSHSLTLHGRRWILAHPRPSPSPSVGQSVLLLGDSLRAKFARSSGQDNRQMTPRKILQVLPSRAS